MPPIYLASQLQLADAYAKQQQKAAFMSRDNSALARRLEGIVRGYPNVNAATAVALAEAGYDKDSVEVRSVAELQVKRDQQKGSGPLGSIGSAWGSITGAITGAAKPVVRTALTALDAPREYVEGGFRGAVQDLREGDVLGAATAPAAIGVGMLLPAVPNKRADDAWKQTRLRSAIDVSKQTGLSIPQALNNNPSIPPDGDVTALLDRNQSSWFSGPNSLAEKQQVAAARAASLTNGRATTYGRVAGSIVGLQPGGAAHGIMSGLVKLADSPWVDEDDADSFMRVAQKVFEGGIDATAAVVTDPVGLLSGGWGRTAAQAGRFGGRTVEITTRADAVMAGRAGEVTEKATKAGRTFVAAPPRPPIVVEGTRPTVVFQNAADLILKSKKGDRLAEYLAREDNYPRLAAVLGKHVPPSTVIRILDEKDPVRMKQVLIDEVGNGFIDTAPRPLAADLTAVGMPAPKVASVASAVTKRPKSRLRNLAPSESMVYRSDPAWAVEQYTRTLNAIRVGDLKQALTPEFIAKNVEQFARATVDDAADWSAPFVAVMDSAESALVSNGVPREHAREITRVWQDTVTEHRNFWVDAHGKPKHPLLTINGEEAAQAKASLSAEMFTDGIPLIDVASFNKAASSLRKLYESDGWEGAVAVGDAITAFFKFMVLPMRGPAWEMRNLAELQARMAVEGLSSVYTRPLAALAWRVADPRDSKVSRLLGRAERRSEGRGAIDAAGEDFRLRAELEGNANAFFRTQEQAGGPWVDHRAVYLDEYPVVRKGQLGYLDGIRFNLEKLAGSAEARMALAAESPQHAKNLFWQSKTRLKMAKQEPSLLTREGADRWMDEVVYPRIQETTGGHPELLEAIRQGKINGVPLVRRDARGTPAANKQALAELEKYWDDLPEFTVTRGTTRAGGDPTSLVRGAEVLERQIFNRMFARFGSDPSNYFVNSPAFRELHWQEALRIAPLATPQARARLAAKAREANMPKSMIRQFEADMGPAGKLDVEDVRDLADAKAFDRWLDIVYTSHRKGNWTRSVRMLQPFAAAVADMYRFWGRRLARNPLILHRVELGMHATRQSGFFYSDENGEERFTYPLSQALFSAFGAAGDLSATLKGANMITSSLMPGFGPVVTWPASWFTPDGPEWDEFREFINPYGDPDASGGILEGIAPRHIQKILAGLNVGTAEQRRLREEAFGDVQAYLMSTGNYGTSQSEQERLRRDVKAKGKALWFLTAVAAAGVPASPRANYEFKDKTGRMHEIALVAADFRKMMNADPETANQRLLEKYGDAAFYAVVGGTDGSTQLATEDASILARQHPEVTSRYSRVWSFFTDPDSPYSFREFRRQLDAGDRTVRDTEDRQVAAQTSIASSMYWQYKRQFGPFPTTQEREYLKTVKAAIRKQYPLWDQSFDVMEVQKRVGETFAAAKDPVFADTPAAEAVRAYEKARRSVIDAANGEGLTDSETGWGRAKATEDHRDYLRMVAASLVEQVPEFGTLWERVLSKEMVDDVEGQP